MATSKFIKPYIDHGEKAGAVRKITVSIPLHVLRPLSDERTRRQVNNLRHATNSDLLVEAFLHAFTGQPLPTDEELRRTMATAKKAARKPAAKKAVKKAAAKRAVKKAAVKRAVKKAVKKAVVKRAVKKAVAKKVVKKAAVKRVAKKAAAAKVVKATKTVKAPRAAKASKAKK
jgi:transcriptional regulator of met regulon